MTCDTPSTCTWFYLPFKTTDWLRDTILLVWMLQERVEILAALLYNLSTLEWRYLDGETLIQGQRTVEPELNKTL